MFYHIYLNFIKAMILSYDNRLSFIEYYLHINQAINLTAVRDPQEFYLKHIVDSLTICDLLTISNNLTICDVGTGWWFPLLPLAIAYPQTSCIWLDSTAKKLKAIESIAKHFSLTNIQTIWSRAEHHHHTYDLVTCRAVAYIDKLFPQIIHLVKSWWYIALYKLYSITEDDLVYQYSKQMNLKMIIRHHYKLFDTDCQRVLYILQYHPSHPKTN